MVQDDLIKAQLEDELAKQLADEIQKMADVMHAHKKRRGRLNVINNMLSRGKVGVGNKGFLVQRGDLTKKERLAFNAENKDRKIIIERGAKAIIKVMPTPENMKNAIPNAASQFTGHVARSEAKPGWWFQLPDGGWVQR